MRFLYFHNSEEYLQITSFILPTIKSIMSVSFSVKGNFNGSHLWINVDKGSILNTVNPEEFTIFYILIKAKYLKEKLKSF